MRPNEPLESTLRWTKRLIPASLFRASLPAYHFFLAFFSAFLYGFPSRKLFVIGVTGTNGKTTVVELINGILEQAGYTTALSDTLRFKTGRESFLNSFKMTTPGRFFLQRFLREAVRAGCRYAVIELTSEGARQSRHLFVALDALVFTNLTPEHIESHGSFENYRAAKRSLARALAQSGKKKKYMVANIDDEEGKMFLRIAGRGDAERHPYSLADAEPYEVRNDGVTFTFQGEALVSPLRGIFNIRNLLAASVFARSQGIPLRTIQKALAAFRGVPGRMEKIELSRGSLGCTRRNFSVYVDYAHTPDALRNIYSVFPSARKICVLGATGGGRDAWKRPVLGEIAAAHCDAVIVTNEDPYDEDPQKIIDEVASGVPSDVKGHMSKVKCLKILDRREAIRKALSLAREGDVVIITGKGTDPYIMGPRGEKTPWNDGEVAREELRKMI